LTIALIDGDEAIYKATVIKVEDTDWEAETVCDRPPTFEEACEALGRIIDAWRDAVHADEFIFCLSPIARGLYRRGVFPGYKGARGEKPEQYAPLEAWAHENLPVRWYPGLEADDVMGILSGTERVICSNDKDMKTVPGRLYITGKQLNATISETRADWQWMYQTLMGDSADGFAGCLGCGEKGAAEILDGHPDLRSMVPAVVDRYLAPKKGKYKEVTQTLQDFRRQAILARILRPGDYDIETGNVKFSIPGQKDITFNAKSIAA
jgi:5'-3' exonuclease